MDFGNFSKVFRGVATVVFILVLGELCVPASTNAQVVGATLSGVVTDPSGAVIVGAQVTITNSDTAVSRVVKTDAAGLYTAPNLLPGTYEVSTVAQGFNTVVESGVVLTVAAKQLLNIQLAVGRNTQQVTITAAEPTVELATSTITNEVNATTVREL